MIKTRTTPADADASRMSPKRSYYQINNIDRYLSRSVMGLRISKNSTTKVCESCSGFTSDSDHLYIDPAHVGGAPLRYPCMYMYSGSCFAETGRLPHACPVHGSRVVHAF